MGQSGREEGAEEEQKIDMELKLLSYSQDALAVYHAYPPGHFIVLIVLAENLGHLM